MSHDNNNEGSLLDSATEVFLRAIKHFKVAKINGAPEEIVNTWLSLIYSKVIIIIITDRTITRRLIKRIKIDDKTYLVLTGKK